MKALAVLPGWWIPGADLEYRTARSGGPGGQNVNKVESKVELRLDLSTTALNSGQRRRLLERYPGYHTQDGAFRVVSERFRTQHQNQRDAEQRLVQMLIAVQRPPKPRIGTRPTRASKARRLREKRLRGDLKRSRASGGRRDD